jgi:MoxR-like ATPase
MPNANQGALAMTETLPALLIDSAFGRQLLSGKVEWTTEELAAAFPEKKKGTEELAPPDESRLPLIARVCARNFGVNFEAIRDGRRVAKYLFSTPSGKFEPRQGQVQIVEKIVEKIVRVEVPVEKIVEKIVEVKVDRQAGPDLEVILKFPPCPKVGKTNPQYVTPAWYKRMEAALDAGKHVSIAGPPGGGKSTGPEQYFARKGQPFVVVNGDAGFRRRDIEGTTEIQAGSTFFKAAEFATAAINGWGCILNEVNAADPDALMWINGLLEVPHMVTVHGRAYPVHPNFRLVVTYNPGLVGTKALPQAFKDRFFPIKLGFPPRSFVRKLLVTKGMPESAGYADRLLKYAADCWQLHEKGNLRYQISPRRLFDVVFLMESGACQDLEDAIKQAIVDAVDSAADAQMLKKLVTTPLAEVGPVSQYA